MKKVAFFLENKSLSGVDYTNIVSGNPGIGGTEYMIVLIAYLLSIRNNGIQVQLYSEIEGKFPKGLNYTVAENLQQAIFLSEHSQQCDYFIYRHNPQAITLGILKTKSKMKFIPWCHNFVTWKELKYYALNPSIFKIVNVGREQLDLYRDCKAFLKSTYIFNCVDTNCLQRYNITQHPFEKRSHIVTYIGSIIPAKGFHLLAAAWPKVLKYIPDAELYIIGSGKLYSRNAALGAYGIAEKSYEEKFIKYLSKDGNILPCVHFMGIMGEEKNEILLHTKVGVPNPSGNTETFGITAVEMQIMGAKVVAIKCPGYLDTVKNGYLYSNPDQLADYIIKALTDSQSNYNASINYFNSHFSQNKVVERWEELILSGNLSYDTELSNPKYRYKQMKEVCRKIKQQIPFLYNLMPPIERLLNLKNKLKMK